MFQGKDCTSNPYAAPFTTPPRPTSPDDSVTCFRVTAQCLTMLAPRKIMSPDVDLPVTWHPSVVRIHMSVKCRRQAAGGPPGPPKPESSHGKALWQRLQHPHDPVPITNESPNSYPSKSQTAPEGKGNGKVSPKRPPGQAATIKLKMVVSSVFVESRYQLENRLAMDTHKGNWSARC